MDTNEPAINTEPAVRRSGRVINPRTNDPGNSNGSSIDFALTPLTVEDRQRWKGWCEVESDPAFFNVMIREFGVEGVKVQEIFSLDEEMLAILPQPVYGLIFLFQFTEEDPAKQVATCPDHVWFANQTTSNSCASVALLNILMNIEDVEFGQVLKSFQSHTQEMTPPIRGECIGNFDFIRNIHNSFARKMDILNSDLYLSNDATAKKSKTSKSKSSAADEDQAGFHFIAFVPIGGHVWKLDGLERQPVELGKFEGDWMSLARPIIEERMQQYEGDQIRFSLISLCKSPLKSIPDQLAANVRSVITVEAHLDLNKPDWRDFAGDEKNDNLLRGPDANYGVSQVLLDSSKPLSKYEALDSKDKRFSKSLLLDLRAELVADQARLRSAYMEETADTERDNERAAARRHDHTPFIYRWLMMLAEKGVLQQLVEESEN